MTGARQVIVQIVSSRRAMRIPRTLFCYAILVSLVVLLASCGASSGEPQQAQQAQATVEETAEAMRGPSVLPSATAAEPTPTQSQLPSPVPTAMQTTPPTAQEPTATPTPTVSATPTDPPAPSPTATARPTLGAQDVQRISAVEAKALLDAGQAVLYDVRSAAEYGNRHAAGALSFPDSEADARYAELPADKSLVFY